MPIEINDPGKDKKKKELKKEIAKQSADTQIDRQNRITSILGKVEADLKKGNRIIITQDMRDLGIDGKVTELIFKHSYFRRLAKITGHIDDSEEKERIDINLRSSLG